MMEVINGETSPMAQIFFHGWYKTCINRCRVLAADPPKQLFGCTGFDKNAWRASRAVLAKYSFGTNSASSTMAPSVVAADQLTFWSFSAQGCKALSDPSLPRFHW